MDIHTKAIFTKAIKSEKKNSMDKCCAACARVKLLVELEFFLVRVVLLLFLLDVSQLQLMLDWSLTIKIYVKFTQKSFHFHTKSRGNFPIGIYI